MNRSTCLFAAVLGIAAPALGQECEPLEPLVPRSGDRFGCAVATDGRSLAISADKGGDDEHGIPDAGSVTVFDASGKIEAVFAGEASGDRFGLALALAANTLVVGAPGAGDSTGAAYVFRRSGAGWSREQPRLTAGERAHRGAAFGEAVALRADGDLIAVGAPAYSAEGSLAGAVDLFQRGAEGWTRSRLKAEPGPFAGFGSALAIGGDILAVGAPFAEGSRGEVWVFRRRGADWDLLRRITAGSFARAGAQFGSAVALGGEVLAVAATRDSNGLKNGGAVYLFSSDGATLRQRLTPSDPRAGDLFGSAISLDGGRLLVGARLRDNGKGAVYLFEEAEGRWTEVRGDLGSPGGELGQAVALRGDRAVVGAYLRDRAESCVLREELPDLVCTITGPATLPAGGQATYSVTVLNQGKAVADGVELADFTPAGLSLEGAGAPCGSLPCLLGPIDAGDSRRTTVTFRAPQGCPAAKSFRPLAKVAGSTKESDSGNNTCAPDRPTRVERAPARLACEKRALQPSARPGESLVYRVEVRNLGCEPALNIDFTDPTPPHLERDCDGFPCPEKIAKIPPLGTVTVPVAFQVPFGYPAPEIVNEARVSLRAHEAACSAATPFRCQDLFRDPKLDLPLGTWGIVQGTPREVAEGATVIYEIVLANGGPGLQPDNDGHELEHVVPGALALKDVEADRGQVSAFDVISPPIGDPRLFWDGALAPCETVTIKATATVVGASGSEVCLQGVLSFDLDRDGTNEAVRTTGVRGAGGEGEPLCFRIVSAPPA